MGQRLRPIPSGGADRAGRGDSGGSAAGGDRRDQRAARARARRGRALLWEPSLGRLRFASGAEAQIFSGSNPEALRGPEHHIAWCDELAKWPKAEAAWNNLRLGFRLGERPRALVTTPPRAVTALRDILAEEGGVKTGGPSRANPQLADDAVAALEALHAGTRFGRQELDGVLVEDLEGALWSWQTIEQSRTSPLVPGPSPAEARGAYRRIVVGVDPPASAEGVCGIVVCGLGGDGIGYVLADLSAGGLSPDGWARKVSAAVAGWSADRVVAEANNGGAMVEAVLRGAAAGLPVKLVHASQGKNARAEPVAALFESKRARLAGRFPELEEQLAGLTVGGGYEGPGRSPDRADAIVWALTELMLGARPREPRVTFL
jgi:phage terminase large subunit-like protein